ncbi:gluconeogenesis factor YvcK family protein [Mycoplasma sp. P36-A1]|uniref:gluconeogenesis factor YvcK family protein n=1 Tax=Mycoplasma sp. P36-A1 TaxID=3252900 RepID=UPI003C2F657D
MRRKTPSILNVVCIGGGSGLSHFVKGIKDLERLRIDCIVTVADNGGSTGTLKEELNMPAVGDIRNVLLALSNAPSDMDKMLSYRFDKGGLSGHSLGNIMIAGLYQSTDCNLIKTIESLSEIFNVRGNIIPSTSQVVDIKATLENNQEVVGEKQIGKIGQKIKRIEYVNNVIATREAVLAIRKADIIIYSIGSLYTSLIPNLIIPEIRRALYRSRARKIYFANLMSQPGETDNYKLSDYVESINNHLGFLGIDVIIVNNQKISQEALERYSHKKAYPVIYNKEKIDKRIKIIEYDIAKIDEENKIMHSPKKIKKLLGEDISCLFQET